jgi:nitrogen fixation/metabolism regulation signal transduction histidine kinase
MVDEFSRFARLPLTRLESADLNQVVLNAVALYEDRLNGIELGTNLDSQMPVASLDSEQMRRVFVNLIDNAIAAMTEIAGERRITIVTRHDVGRGVLIAEVVDTGHGFVWPISSDCFNHTFRPGAAEQAWGWRSCSESFWSITDESAPKQTIPRSEICD